jgi:hypothetical protein
MRAGFERRRRVKVELHQPCQPRRVLKLFENNGLRRSGFSVSCKLHEPGRKRVALCADGLRRRFTLETHLSGSADGKSHCALAIRRVEPKLSIPAETIGPSLDCLVVNHSASVNIGQGFMSQETPFLLLVYPRRQRLFDDPVPGAPKVLGHQIDFFGQVHRDLNGDGPSFCEGCHDGFLLWQLAMLASLLKQSLLSGDSFWPSGQQNKSY